MSIIALESSNATKSFRQILKPDVQITQKNAAIFILNEQDQNNMRKSSRELIKQKSFDETIFFYKYLCR